MIHEKLLQFQAKQIVLSKSAENPHFRSKYVPLNEVLANALPVLNELKVVVVQTPSADGLTTTLYDTEDSTSIESFLPYVNKTDPQKLGSNNTYNRRYALVTMLGLGDTDDDANEASTPPQQTPAAQQTQPAQPAQQKEGYAKEESIKDGEHTVIITKERSGNKNGKPWQRVSTGEGAAWNNDKNGLQLEVGEQYEVVVKGGSILQAYKVGGDTIADEINIDDIPF